MSSCSRRFEGEEEDDDFQPSKRPLLRASPRMFATQNRSRVLKESSCKAEDAFVGPIRLKRSKLCDSISAGKENFGPILNQKNPRDSPNVAAAEQISFELCHFLGRKPEPNLLSDRAGFHGSSGGSESSGLRMNEREISSSVVAIDVDGEVNEFELVGECCSLDMIESIIDCSHVQFVRDSNKGLDCSGDNNRLELNDGYLKNSIEGRLMSKTRIWDGDSKKGRVLDDEDDELEVGKALDALTKLCGEGDCDFQREESGWNGDNGVILCPLCGVDISDLEDELRLLHTNDCLDKSGGHLGEILLPDDIDHPLDPKRIDVPPASSHRVLDISPVIGWLRSLGLERYEEIFLREEIDWETLKWLTEEDLSNIGITALGPRKKLIHALDELRDLSRRANGESLDGSGDQKNSSKKDKECSTSKAKANESKNASTKLITDYFLGSVPRGNKISSESISGLNGESPTSLSRKGDKAKTQVKRGISREVPRWCCIPGTPFRVDAFRYLRRDCSHWFLTHFHLDHYQGLTRSFCHGKIYCSVITAKLVNMKLGIPWDKIEVLPPVRKVTIADVQVTCLDANHCPGSIMILFEPPNGQAVLHTGDFRFGAEIAHLSIWRECRIHTLILDTTYCNPQYDFPKQEDVTQFVIDAIQAESFNPSTLFLIGSYTVGKERLFLEVARALQRKIYVDAAKFRIIQCFGYPEEDLRWFTMNEHDSHIHVVPMWTLASFKRLKHIANQYSQRFSLVVAFSPTGWTFGKGKKSSGRRWQQGTIIRYEVPYSEHSSFSELKEFVKLLSPTNIIPSVNNDSAESVSSMLSCLSSLF